MKKSCNRTSKSYVLKLDFFVFLHDGWLAIQCEATATKRRDQHEECRQLALRSRLLSVSELLQQARARAHSDWR